MEIVELNNIELLAPYRQVWQGLLAQTPQATFFQSLEWLEAWWKHFGANKRLRTIMVSNHGARQLNAAPSPIEAFMLRAGGPWCPLRSSLRLRSRS